MIEAVLRHGEPNAEKRECFDCAHCKAAVNWWCKSPEAFKQRGTRLPGETNCEFWKPVRTLKELTWFERSFNDYIIINPRK